MSLTGLRVERSLNHYRRRVQDHASLPASSGRQNQKKGLLTDLHHGPTKCVEFGEESY